MHLPKLLSFKQTFLGPFLTFFFFIKVKTNARLSTIVCMLWGVGSVTMVLSVQHLRLELMPELKCGQMWQPSGQLVRMNCQVELCMCAGLYSAPLWLPSSRCAAFACLTPPTIATFISRQDNHISHWVNYGRHSPGRWGTHKKSFS